MFSTLFLCIACLDFEFSVIFIRRKSDSIRDESDDDGSDSGSAVTSTFTSRFEDYVGSVHKSVGCVYDFLVCVCGMGSGVFVPIGIKSIGDVVPLVMCVPIGAESKLVDSLKCFGSQSPDFSSYFEDKFYSYNLFLTLSRLFQKL